MAALIRVADAADAEGVTQLFRRIYESGRGPGAASEQGLWERTFAVLFPEQGGPTVLVYVLEGDVQGVAAYRLDLQHGSASIVTVQAHDTVRGRSAAQQLLGEAARMCAAEGATVLVTEVPADDVRARGFLRREGFSPVVENDAVPASHDDAVVTYRRLLSADATPAHQAPDAAQAVGEWQASEQTPR